MYDAQSRVLKATERHVITKEEDTNGKKENKWKMKPLKTLRRGKSLALPGS